jgi:hypothetical protein
VVLDNAFKILSTPNYLMIWGISTALVMWIYMGYSPTTQCMTRWVGSSPSRSHRSLAESSRHNGTTWQSARLAR